MIPGRTRAQTLSTSQKPRYGLDSGWQRYLLAVPAVTIALALRVWPLHSLGSTLAWLTFYPAVMIAAVFGGFGAGFLTLGLASLAALYLWPWISPAPFISSNSDWLGMAVFVVNGALVSGVAGAMRQAQQRARAAIRQAEDSDRKRQVAQSTMGVFAEWAPTAVAMFDKDMRYLLATRRWRQDYGLGERDLIGHSHYEIFPDIPESWIAVHNRCLAGAIESSEADPFRRADGSVQWVRWEARPWRQASGEIGGIFVWAEDVTATRQAEQTLRESEERFRGAFQTAPHGMALVSPLGRWLKVNASLCRLVGYTEAELLEIDFQSITHPDDLSADLTLVQDVLAGKIANYQMEKRYLRKDGRIVWILLSVSLVRDEHDAPLHFVAQIQDIGARKDAEVKLRLVVDTVSNGILVVGRDGNIRMASAFAEKIFGYPTGAMVGQSVEMLIPESLRVAHQAHRQRFAAVPSRRSMGLNFDLRGRRQDGSEFPIEVGLSPVESPDGPEVVVSLADISERKRMEESQSRLAAIIESSGDAIVAKNLDGIVTSWNPAAERLFGYTASEIIGQPIIRLFPPERQGDEDELLARIRRGESVANYDAVRLRKDGTQIEVSVTLSPVKDAAGRIVGVSKVIRDIGERKRLEGALRAAKEAAESADQAKSQFLANMSHEIRTPMNAILGLGHLLERTDLSPEQRGFIEKMTSAGRSLLDILSDILDFSKIEADRIEISNGDFRLSAIFDDLAAIMSSIGANKDLELAVTLDPAIPSWLKGDAARLQQVLVNLAGNAIKFTSTGSVALRADLDGGSGASVNVRFSVRDTGIGISAEQQARLFKPFSQGDSTTTRRFGGTGLGLAISKRLVELMGGEIQLVSELGRGSEFSFTLCFEVAQAAGEEPRRFKNRSVLVVDDDIIARSSISATVRGLGWKEEMASSGEQALEKLQRPGPVKASFDVLLIDWQMPGGIDGLETGRRIREARLNDHVPIILLVSAFNREEALHSPRAGAADAMLVKPVTTSTLYNAVVDAESRLPGGAQKSTGVLRRLPIERLRGIHILVVEDNAINQEVARRILEQEGASVEVAEDGQQAVERIARGHEAVDLILMDVQMPVMDGFEASRRIRANDLAGGLPIIALTADVRPSDRKKCQDAGMNDFVGKPLDVERLVHTILHYVSARPDDSAPNPRGETVSCVEGAVRLDRIPGLDAAQAKLRLGGNEALLCSMLRSLADKTKGLLDRVRADLEAGAANQVASVMHGLRGSAGNIGVSAIARLAGEIEMAVRDGRTEALPGFLSELEAALIDFQTGVEIALVEEEAKTVPADKPSAPEMAKLLGLLDDGDLAALDVYRNLESALKSRLMPDRWTALAAAMSRLDFKAAAAVIGDVGAKPP